MTTTETTTYVYWCFAGNGENPDGFVDYLPDEHPAPRFAGEQFFRMGAFKAATPCAANAAARKWMDGRMHTTDAYVHWCYDKTDRTKTDGDRAGYFMVMSDPTPTPYTRAGWFRILATFPGAFYGEACKHARPWMTEKAAGCICDGCDTGRVCVYWCHTGYHWGYNAGYFEITASEHPPPTFAGQQFLLLAAFPEGLQAAREWLAEKSLSMRL